MCCERLALRFPVIAVVNGACAGIGLAALACFYDLRFGSRDAKLTTAATRLGLPADEVGRVPRGRRRLPRTSTAAILTVPSGPDTAHRPRATERSLACVVVKRREKADRIGEILDDLYAQPPIPLDHRDPYTLLVAVALSAQTTDKKVNQITPALFAVADTPEKMAAMRPDQILELIREVGLAPTKAKNLWTAANQILDAGGEVLPDWTFLESLAGVGHKTASVVMAQAFGVPAFAVDTHIHRLAARWGLSDGSNVEHTERDLKAVFPVDTWIRRHLQIIFFGREYCPALRHDFALCPICSWAATKTRAAQEARR